LLQISFTLSSISGRKFDKYVPSEDIFEKGLYMFDIGQNDLAGAFYSKTLDQVLASIPTILLEFESGIKVGVKSSAFILFIFGIILFKYIKTINIKEFSFFVLLVDRDYMMRGLDISGYTIQVLWDAWLRM
jgi:hypothetical protein